MALRPAQDSDRDAVLALGVREEEVWFGAAEVSADEVGEWVDEEGGVVSGAVSAGDDGAVRGFASPGRHGAVYIADPAHTDAVADELLPWLLERDPAAELLTFGADTARVAAFERHGFAHFRSTFTLLRPASTGPLPDAPFPAGVTVAPYTLGTDDEAVHHLIYVDADWSGVEGHTERDLAAWQEMMRPCRSLFVASRDSRLVGWVAGRILESGRGYIVSLAVAAAERKQGLGRALLVHALTDLQAQGAPDLSLDVEARNASALGLYRSVGFEPSREWRIFRPGAPATSP